MDNTLMLELLRALFRVRQANTELPASQQLAVNEIVALGMLTDNRSDAENNVFAGDLMTRLSLSKAAVSQMINSFEARGWIARAFNPHNRRKIILTLTTEGRRVFEDGRVDFEQFMTYVLDHFGHDEAQQLIDLLGKLNDALAYAKNKINE